VCPVTIIFLTVKTSGYSRLSLLSGAGMHHHVNSIVISCFLVRTLGHKSRRLWLPFMSGSCASLKTSSVCRDVSDWPELMGLWLCSQASYSRRLSVGRLTSCDQHSGCTFGQISLLHDENSLEWQLPATSMCVRPEVAHHSQY
jgi:hypothetical protein